MPTIKRTVLPALLVLATLIAPARAEQGKGARDSSTAPTTPRSGKLAALMSLALPGTGQAYAGGRVSARFFWFTEGTLWAGNIGFRLLAGARDRTYRSYAAAHAGVRPSGKDARYFDEVAAYPSLAARNSAARYLDGPGASLLPETPDNAWAWDSEASRGRFIKLRGASTAARRNALLCVGGLALNRFAAAIHAAYLARRSAGTGASTTLLLVPDLRGGWALALARTL